MTISNARIPRALSSVHPSRDECVDHVAAHRTMVRLKRWRGDTPISSFVASTTVVARLYVTLSKEAAVMADSTCLPQTSSHCPCRDLSCWREAQFLTQGPWCRYRILQGWLDSMAVFSFVNGARPLRSSMAFTMIVLKTSILYLNDSRWIPNNASSNIAER